METWPSNSCCLQLKGSSWVINQTKNQQNFKKSAYIQAALRLSGFVQSLLSKAMKTFEPNSIVRIMRAGVIGPTRELLLKSHNARDPYLTMYHFVTKMRHVCTFLSHCGMFVWCIVGIVRCVKRFFIEDGWQQRVPYISCRMTHKHAHTHIYIYI